MPILLPLKKMSRDEKLRAMEAIWADLSRDEGRFESPAWHKDELRKAEHAFRSGFGVRRRSLRDASDTHFS